jgi:hypothetical protein
MTRPMAAPAGNGLRQNENRHQFGNQCLHNAPEILPNHYGHRQSRQRGLRKNSPICGAGSAFDAEYPRIPRPKSSSQSCQ